MAQRTKRQPRPVESVEIEAACGYEDAERRWLTALRVLAEYGADTSTDTSRDP